MGAILFLMAALMGQAGDEYGKAEAARVEKFRKILEKMPDDPEACFQLGRFLCFVQADWDQGLPLLAKGKDKTLAEFAQYELGAVEIKTEKESLLTGAVFDFGDQVAPDLVKGDLLWELMKKYKDTELRNIMNRAIWHYKQALGKVDEAKKKKLTERVQKAMDRFRATYIHPGRVIDGPMKGWGVVVSKGEKVEGVATDESRSHLGRASLKVTPAKAGLLVTERKPLHPGDHTLSFWYMSEGTVAPDLFHVLLFDKSEGCTHVPARMPPDKGEIPIWIHVEMKVKVTEEILNFRLYVDNVGMRDGSIWIDDLSFRSPKGEELVLNGGFEER